MIDTHMHLVETGRLAYPWVADIEELAGKDFTYADYCGLTGGKVKSSIFMETAVADDQYQAEAEWVAGLIADARTNVIAQIAACHPESEGFEAWIERAAELHVVGYRRILHVVDDEMSRPDGFRRNVSLLGSKGLSFDMCFLARQLTLAADFAGSCDGTQLILDHCGVPDIANEERPAEVWLNGIKELAAMDHVACKLSGVMAYCAKGQASHEVIRPYVDHVLECFGVDRVVWGSDWPVVDMGNGLVDWLAVTDKILQDLSEDERRKVEVLNASRIYRLA